VAMAGRGVLVGGTGVDVLVSTGIGVSVGSCVSVGVSVGASVGVAVMEAGVSVGVEVSMITMIGVGTLRLAGAPMLATTNGVGNAAEVWSARASAVTVDAAERAAVTLALPDGSVAADATEGLAPAPLRRRSRPPTVARHRNKAPNSAAPVKARTKLGERPVDCRANPGAAWEPFFRRKVGAGVGNEEGCTGAGAVATCPLAAGSSSFRRNPQCPQNCACASTGSPQRGHVMLS
jgi:hypothetical protein